MKILWTLIILVSFSVQGICEDLNTEILIAKSDNSKEVESELKEANKNFTFNEKPIHPGCVEQFNVNLADSGPPIVRAVDVAACASSNEFFMDYKVSEDGYIGYEYEGSGGKNYFGYKYIGKAKGGILILDTRSSGGGTMVAMSVFLTRFTLENYRSFDDQGKLKIEERLIMKCIGQINRGDRDIGTIELKNNKLILGESQYRKKSEVISLD
ncbi:MAG: hypothetical protein KAJ31_08695 [Deltaproteobacteria bacterium]|nr:hypothetical protein [Deltaproteobacteria bacterium]MCK5710148.1 hypothetical protein [Deltaproteobacteria bacterium]